MTSGGSRARSGPLPQEGSGRSDKRGYRLTELPNTAYTGQAPEFPLPDQSLREAEVWREVWRLPQAHAWSRPSESWRLRTIAMYVRQSVKCEAPDIGAAHVAQIHRFADQIGLTDAGLAGMGFKISDHTQAPPPKRSGGKKSSRDRLQVVGAAPRRLRAPAQAPSDGNSA